jgi:hypothetical protein
MSDFDDDDEDFDGTVASSAWRLELKALLRRWLDAEALGKSEMWRLRKETAAAIGAAQE